MLWPDLAAYGDIKLKVSSRGSAPAIMFVMDGGDAIADALRHSGFRRMKSGLWLRTFRPSDCADILRGLAFDLPLAIIRETDPIEILLGYCRPQAVSADQVAEVVETAAAAADVDMVCEAHDRENCLFGPNPSEETSEKGVFPSDTEGAIATPSVGGQEASPAVTSQQDRFLTFAEALAALSELAAWIGRRGTSPLKEDAGLEPGEGRGIASALVDHDLAIETLDADNVFEVAFSWIVTAGASDARLLTGLSRLEERNYLVAKLSCRDDALAALRQVGMIARCAPDVPDVRILAVVRGIDGCGFGSSGDFLLIGDPGEGVGPLLAPAIAQDAEAA